MAENAQPEKASHAQANSGDVQREPLDGSQVSGEVSVASFAELLARIEAATKDLRAYNARKRQSLNESARIPELERWKEKNK